jgi:hypothetical protein
MWRGLGLFAGDRRRVVLHRAGQAQQNSARPSLRLANILHRHSQIRIQYRSGHNQFAPQAGHRGCEPARCFREYASRHAASHASRPK